MYYLSESDVIKCEIDLHLNYRFKELKKSSKSRYILFNDKNYFVQHVINFKRRIIRSLQLSNSLREELKIIIFDNREKMMLFMSEDTFFLSFTIFINEFDLYKNMYQLLMSIYLTVANLTA